MLEVVHIRDYALIDALDLEFQPGMNVLSGETGAGKSIVAGALGLALGGRASAEAVRAGAEKASIEAVFRIAAPSPRLLDLLNEQDISLEDGMLIASRILTSDGRSRAQVNGRAVTIAQLAAIGDELVDLHGQHEHQSLLRPECQLSLLDAFSNAEDDVRAMQKLAAQLSQLSREIEALETDDRDRARQADLLRYEINEIDAAGLAPGEEEEVRSRLHRITHAETIFTLANQAYATLYESETTAAMDSVNSALNALDELAEIDEQFQELRTQLLEARASIESVSMELRAHTDRMEFDAEELDALNRRLSCMGDLKRKYGPDIAAVLAYRDRCANTLADLDNRDERLAAARAKLASLRQQAESQAARLSEIRRQAAKSLDQDIVSALRALDMPNARFSTHFENIPLCAHGTDRVSFLLAANAGEPLKPMRLVASGGEISRIMLAIKSVFAGQDMVPVLIFDEIDAGIGGATARRVAEKLSELAASHQVICITHLAQIAAAASTQFVVEKTTTADRSITRVRPLDTAARIDELARLLDGSASSVSREHARALLAECQSGAGKPTRRKGKSCTVD